MRSRHRRFLGLLDFRPLLPFVDREVVPADRAVEGFDLCEAGDRETVEVRAPGDRRTDVRELTSLRGVRERVRVWL